MGSECAKEAERQAAAITRDLIEVGKTKGLRVSYQKREARFALCAGVALSQGFFAALSAQQGKAVSICLDAVTGFIEE